MKVFTSISLLVPVAERFRKFSKELGNSHSEILAQMMDFFQLNKLSPTDSLAGDMQSRDQQLNKRLNTIIGILRDMERTQTQPTLAILESFLLKASPTPVPAQPRERKKQPEPPSPEPAAVPAKKMVKTSLQVEMLRDLQYLIEQVKPEKNWLGQEKLMIAIPREEFERLKIKIKNY